MSNRLHQITPGDRFDLWRVLCADPDKTSKWICRCECGALSSVEGSTLARGRSRACKSCASKRAGGGNPLKHDHTGQRFGMLLAVEHRRGEGWLCRCDCGVEKIIPGGHLRLGQVSCGCSNPVKRKGAGHPRFNRAQVTYVAAHQRVRAVRGPARTHACINCGHPANSWAYRGDSAEELTEAVEKDQFIKKAGSILRYSANPDDYDPMCWRCHARKDVAEAQARAVE